MIRLCAPTFTERDKSRIGDVLDSGMLVQGRFVAEFEAALEAELGGIVVACSSGTAALHLALLALDIGAGDEVIVPAFTWPSAAHVVRLVGAEPVFVDIDPDTLALDPDALESALGSRTRAIIPIHQFGIPAPMDAVMRFAEANALRVIEDAACALGSRSGGRAAGTIAEMGCFSFHPRKVLTTGEGGVIHTASPKLAERLRVLRNHGQDPDGGLERFVDAAPNYRLSELHGALGVGQMDRLEAELETRSALGARYLERLADAEGVRVPAGLADPGNNFQSFVVDVGPTARDAIMARMRRAGVESTIGTYAVPVQPVYRAANEGRSFPYADHAMRSLITLPLHARMRPEDVDTVVSALRRAVEEDRT